VGAAFGRVLAHAIEGLWRAMANPSPFVLLEQGASDGYLMEAILEEVRPEFREALRPVVVEPIEACRMLQEKRLSTHGVQWFETLEQGPAFTGIHLSNELLDAFPFHLLIAEDGGWRELRVCAEHTSLGLIPGPVSAEAQADAALLPSRPDGYLTEVRPAVGRWVQALAGVLREGYVLLFDYGMSAGALRDLSRTRGTFACYREHRRDDNLLEDPGGKDITAHVDFSDLAARARDAGFKVFGPREQGRYLVGCAEELLQTEACSDTFLRQFRTLIHPELLGHQFHAMALAAGNARSLPTPRGF
jgi:SAM-dependent MidA family methyltransferase